MQQEFFDLIERFRDESDPAEVERLGDQLGQIVFGGSIPIDSTATLDTEPRP